MIIVIVFLQGHMPAREVLCVAPSLGDNVARYGLAGGGFHSPSFWQKCLYTHVVFCILFVFRWLYAWVGSFMHQVWGTMSHYVARYGLAGGGFRFCLTFCYCPFHTTYPIVCYPTTPRILVSFFILGKMWHGMGLRAGGSALGWVVPLPQFLSTFHPTKQTFENVCLPMTMLHSMGSRAGVLLSCSSF